MSESQSPTFLPTFSPTDDGPGEQSPRLRTEALLVASFSVFLYGIVFCISLYYYNKFVRLEFEHNNQVHRSPKSQYDHSKKLFFGILAMSSFLEMPAYIGCLANDGPTDCEWRSFDEVIFWFFHLLALCGFACCIVIPCVLWSDMINKKDGKLFFSAFPYDPIKQYFRVLILIYFINTVIDIIMTFVYWRESDRLHYRDAPTYSICALMECVLIVLLSTGCLYCGLRLECYVHVARLKPNVELKFLFTLNVILTMIVLSFLGRASLVMRFAPGVPESYQHPVNYTVYTLIARWTPDVFCQLLLILIMRVSGREARDKKVISVIGYNVSSSMTSGKFNSFLSTGSSKHLLSGEEFDSLPSSEVPLLQDEVLMKYDLVKTHGRRFDSENYDETNIPIQNLIWNRKPIPDSDDDTHDHQPTAVVEIKSESLVSSLTQSGKSYLARIGEDDDDENSADKNIHDDEDSLLHKQERFHSPELEEDEFSEL